MKDEQYATIFPTISEKVIRDQEFPTIKSSRVLSRYIGWMDWNGISDVGIDRLIVSPHLPITWHIDLIPGFHTELRLVEVLGGTANSRRVVETPFAVQRYDIA